MNKKVVLALAILGMFFAGCGMPHLPGTDDVGSGQNDISNGQGNLENSTVEVNDSLFSPDATNGNYNTYKFVVSDSRYITENGYTLWAEKYENKSEKFEPFTVRMYKESGKANAGYGIVFCSQEIDEAPYLLTVLINEQGMYSIGKVKNGVFTYIETWKSCNSIREGAGIINTVTVNYDETEKRFGLQINNEDVTTFAVSETIIFNGSKKGFVAVIAENEEFPAKPVKVTYEKCN